MSIIKNTLPKNNQKKKYPLKNKGVIQLLIIVIMGILILSLLDVNLKALFNNETVKQNFKFAGGFFLKLWQDYFVYYVSYAWELWIDYIWLPVYSFISSRLFGSK